MRSKSAVTHKTSPLTERQKAVVQGLLAGKSIKEIAADLGISFYGAKDHLKRIYAKECVKTARELVLKMSGKSSTLDEAQRPRNDGEWLHRAQAIFGSPMRSHLNAMLGLSYQIGSSVPSLEERHAMDRLRNSGYRLLGRFDHYCLGETPPRQRELEIARELARAARVERAAHRWLDQAERLIGRGPNVGMETGAR